MNGFTARCTIHLFMYADMICSKKNYMSSFFCDVTHCTLVVSHRYLRTTYQSHFQWSSLPVSNNIKYNHLCCITSQKSEDLIYTTVEASNHIPNSPPTENFHSLKLQRKQCMVFHQTAGEVSKKQLLLTKSGLSNYRFCCITWFSWSSFVNSSDSEFILCSFLQAIYGCRSNITYFFSFFPILSKLFLYTNRNFNLLLYTGIKKIYKSVQHTEVLTFWRLTTTIVVVPHR